MRIVWNKELFHSWGNKPKQKAREKQYNAEYYKKNTWRWDDNKSKKHKKKGKGSLKNDKDSDKGKRKVSGKDTKSSNGKKKKSKDKKQKKQFEQESVTKIRVAYGNKGRYMGTETIKKQKMVKISKPKKARAASRAVDPSKKKIKDVNKLRIKRGRKKLKNFINKYRRS